MSSFTVISSLLLAATCLGSGCRKSPALPDTMTAGRQRVISLAPSLTEMIVAIGAADQLVGRSSACDYPPEALANVPVVGGFGVPSLEGLLIQKPTLIVDVALADKSLEQRMQSAGLRREHIPCNRLDDIPAAIRRLGDLLQRQEAAENLAAGIETEIGRLREARSAKADDDLPLVFAEMWSDPLMTVGRRSFIAECIRLAGANHLGDETDAEYYYISQERVLERNPDILVMLYMTAAQAPFQRVSERIGWEALKAVQGGRIYSDFDPDTLLRPGPRILDGIAQLRAVIADGTAHAEP